MSYIIWKVIAQKLPSPDARTEFSSAYGRELLSQVWPEAEEEAAAALSGRSVGIGPAPSISPEASSEPSRTETPEPLQTNSKEAALLYLIIGLLDRLEAQGYMCRYQVVWGEAPGTWPQDWMIREPRVVVTDRQLENEGHQEVSVGGGGGGSAVVGEQQLTFQARAFGVRAFGVGHCLATEPSMQAS